MRVEKTPVLIVGGGVAGLAAAESLARLGLASLLVERSARLGGRAADFCCKAVEGCARCGACLLADLISQVATRPEIKILTQAGLIEAQGRDGVWQVELAPQTDQDQEQAPALAWAPALGQPMQVQAQAVILAVGHTPFDPRRKTRFGYGRVDGVITASELERTLAQGGPDPAWQRVAFIQCVGSRDQSLGNLFCSRVCCGFGLRLARLIKTGQPQSQVTFFHMDLQNYGRAWEQELPALREQIEFIRAMPGEVRSGPNGAEVLYADAAGRPARAEFDLVVLSVGLMPPAGAEELIRMFSLASTPDGFLGEQADQVAGGAPGVFVAGSARGPRSIAESMEHAALAAQVAWEHVQGVPREAALA